MKTLFNKYLATIFGILSSVFVMIYILTIFFAGVNPLVVFSFLLNGKKVDIGLLTSFSQVMHIVSTGFLFFFYFKYFFVENGDNVIRVLSVLFSAIAVVGLFFSSNIENLFFLVSLNAVLLAVTIFLLCIAKFYYEESGTHPLVKMSRVLMTMSVVAIIMFVFSAVTYYDLTAKVLNVMMGTIVSLNKTMAISFICYALGCILQIAEFILLFFAENMLAGIRERRLHSHKR